MSRRNDELREAMAEARRVLIEGGQNERILAAKMLDQVSPALASLEEDAREAIKMATACDIETNKALERATNAEERARLAEEARDGWREAARRDLERALRAEARVAELEGALRPFAELGVKFQAKNEDGSFWCADGEHPARRAVTIGQLRAAAYGYFNAALLPAPEAPRG